MSIKRPSSSKLPRKQKISKSTVPFGKTTLPSGIRVLTESYPTSRAVSCGVWIESGTRDESAKEAGLAHFIEHMVFKRTENRSAYEIARDMEAVGGDLNAFTSRENTTYVTHSLKEHLGLSLDVLADLVCRPKFDAVDIRKEKSVVIQEIAMAEEQIEDNIFDRYFELAFPGSPLGKPILGTEKSISETKRSSVLEFYARAYQPANIVVSAAGNLDHEDVVRLVKKHLVFPKPMMAKVAKVAKFEPTARPRPEMVGFREVVRRPSEQAHILVGLPSSDFCSKFRFEAYIVNSLLGGGMTSWLYQKVREDKGLVYSIYSQLLAFVDAGIMLIYAGTEPKKAPEVIEIIMREIRRLKREGIKKVDLEFFKTQVKGQILLGADDIDSRMNSIAVNEMIFGKHRSVEDVIADIDSVTVDSVNEYIEEFVDESRLGILVMGQLPEEPMRKWLKKKFEMKG